MDDFVVPQISKGSDKTPQAVPPPRAQQYIKLVCMNKDVETTVCYLQHYFILPDFHSPTEVIPERVMFEQLPGAISLFGDLLSNIDETLNASATEELVGAGWRVPKEVAMIRAWKDNMIMYVRRWKNESIYKIFLLQVSVRIEYDALLISFRRSYTRQFSEHVVACRRHG